MTCRAPERALTDWTTGLARSVVIALLVSLLGPAAGAAQSIVVRVGDETTTAVAPEAEIAIPIVVDMSAAAGLDIASLTFALNWDPTRLTFVSTTAGAFGTVIFNETQTGTGLLTASMFNATGATSTFTVATVVQQAGVTVGNTLISIDVTAAGNELGINILASVSPENLNLCVGVLGLLGDVTADDVVNIIDAQQVARFSVGLPVADPDRMATHGDVTEDGAVNIIDAQQIARFSVGLPVPGAPNIAAPMAGGCGGAVIQLLQVRRYITAVLSDADADRILADATTVLQTNDGAGDVSCDVEMVRDGPTTTFETGTGIINSEADFIAVNLLPGNVKMVNDINWCGGPVVGVIGCAPVPGTSFVVVRFVADQEGILWTHEFGHNKGLLHREGVGLLMNPFEILSNVVDR